jgi:hypothetical protein
MAGNAKPTATAKKPTATAKKPTATVKKPTATAKKPTATAKKPTAAAKKPNTKFNLNKLIMLIGRYPQKKGKKMMGGYSINDTNIETIKTLIKEFINREDIRKYIRELLPKVFNTTSGVNGIQPQATVDFSNNIVALLENQLNDTDLKLFMEYINGSIGDEARNNPYVFDDTTNPNNIKYDPADSKHIRHILNINIYIIVHALSKVYFNITNYASDIKAKDIITPKNPQNPPNPPP